MDGSAAEETTANGGDSDAAPAEDSDHDIDGEAAPVERHDSGACGDGDIREAPAEG